MDQLILKSFLIVYFIMYYGVLFVLNTILVAKKIGKNPYVLTKGKGVVSYVESVIKVCGIFIPIIIIGFIVSADIYEMLFPMKILEHFYTDFAGMVLMIIGFAICFVAQLYMRSSWRIGIDKNSNIDLVTRGIFKYSRNPFFLGTITTYLGFFLILPNIVTFSVGVVYFILIQIQVRLEEENMIQVLGEPYKKYLTDVSRWLV